MSIKCNFEVDKIKCNFSQTFPSVFVNNFFAVAALTAYCCCFAGFKLQKASFILMRLRLMRCDQFLRILVSGLIIFLVTESVASIDIAITAVVQKKFI